jgi:hypothetical protein
MDKSFNDQELSDIMKEIEALEDEFKSEGEPAVLAELSELDETASIPAKSKVVPFESKTPSAGKTSGTSMSFKVQGDLKLDLQFDVGGKIVVLNVSENGLTIQMDGGMTFSVPLVEKSASKKSA